MAEDEKNEFPSIGPEKIERAEKENELRSLLELAREKGVMHALEVAKKLNDLYVLGRFFEEMGRILREREWEDVSKK